MITNGRICNNQKKIYTTVSINQIRKEIAMKAKNLIRTLSALVLAIGMLFHTPGIHVHVAQYRLGPDLPIIVKDSSTVTNKPFL